MRRVLVRQEFCIGCGLCRVHCEAHHAGGDDIANVLKMRQSPAVGGIRIEHREIESLSVRCQHCDDAPCIDACLTGAMHRDESSGFVLVDQEKCIGCGTCTLVCPFAAVRQDVLSGKAVKCDGCRDRDTPRCVAACPNGALVLEQVRKEVPAPVPAAGDRHPILV